MTSPTPGTHNILTVCQEVDPNGMPKMGFSGRIAKSLDEQPVEGVSGPWLDESSFALSRAVGAAGRRETYLSSA
jgi:hypothetical protein